MEHKKILNIIKEKNIDYVNVDNLFYIQALLKKEGVCSKEEQLNIIKEFNDCFYYPKIKDDKNVSTMDLFIPKGQYSKNFHKSPYLGFAFSLLHGEFDVLSSEYKEFFIEKTYQSIFHNKPIYVIVLEENKLEYKKVNDLTKSDLSKLIVFIDENNTKISLYSLDKLSLPITDSIVKYFISNVLNTNGFLAEEILNTISLNNIEKETIKAWFFDTFNEKDILRIRNEISHKNKHIQDLIRFIDFEFKDFDTLLTLHKTNKAKYNDYIEKEESIVNYYYEDILELLNILPEYFEEKDFSINKMKKKLLESPNQSISNIKFFDVSDSLSPKF